MSYTKTLMCLANSYKRGGSCVAGRELTAAGFGSWIRPVSARPNQEISAEEQQYPNGDTLNVLDVISIALTRHQPELHQQENHLIDAAYPWRKKRRVSWSELQPAIEDPAGPLWLNGFDSQHGQNDRVPKRRLGEMTRSLYLVHTENLKVMVTLERAKRRRLRAKFDLCGYSYLIAITDPQLERQIPASADSQTNVGDAIICVSLGEEFKGFAYKLAATVITRQTAEV